MLYNIIIKYIIGEFIMVRKYLTIISGLVFTATTGIVCPMNTKAIEDIEPAEVLSMRSEYEKHYDNGDGTYTAYIDTVPLHYYENGEWLDIDNTLIQDENGNYVNRSNSMKVTLSPETSISSVSALSEEPNDNNQMVSIDYNGYSLSWSLIDTISENEPVVMSEDIKETENTISSEESYPVASLSINEQDYIEKEIGMNKLNSKISESVNNLDSSVSYNNIYEDLDCKVDIQPNSVKETLILENPDNLLETYSYFIQSDGLVAELCEDNSVVFSNGEENVFTIPTPFMFDSSEDTENNYNISVTLEEYNNGYIYTLSPDIDWLADESRIYPVMIDPAVSLISKNSICISEKYSTANYSDNLHVGGGKGNRYQTFLEVPDSLINLGTNHVIVEASCQIGIDNNTIGNDTITLSVFKPNRTFELPVTSYTWDYINSWTDNDIVIDSREVTTNSNLLIFDVLPLFQSWMNYKCTDGEIGIRKYPIRLKINNYTDNIYNIYSNSNSRYKPSFRILYKVNTDYHMEYAPERYNAFPENFSDSSMLNFQNRMNCYSYALQMYYHTTEGSNPLYYKLIPGEIGMKQKSSSDRYNAENYDDLCEKYSNQTTLAGYVRFTHKQMKKDADEMGYSLIQQNMTKIVDDKYKFTLPTDFDENNERIIASLGGTYYNGSFDVHFLLRNGNGTCKKHGGTCSLWSHKAGNTPVTSKSMKDENIDLCDDNIVEYTKVQYPYIMKKVSYADDPTFFRTTKNTDIYNSWYENGHFSESTGTTYHLGN